MVSIDVVIPSFRLQSKYLKAIVGMAIPENCRVRFLIIADNPALPVPPEVSAYVDGTQVLLIRNKVNLGASESRNQGIAYSNADWILFLDDDIIPSPALLNAYAEAISEYPDGAGFFGETVFPEPINSFTRGTTIGDMLYFFTYARYYEDTICTTTSNVLVSRKVILDLRFRDTFPKKGGGEDFAFFQELYQRSGRKLKSVKNAPVYHDWWHGGKRNYSQFIRWSYGDYELFRLFPGSTYRSFPNVVEALVLGIAAGLVCVPVTHSLIPLICLTLGVVLGELFVVFIFLLRGKGMRQSIYFAEVMLVRAAADLGRLQGIVASVNFGDLLKRPNFSGFRANRHFHFWPALKFAAYITFGAALIALLS